MGQKCSQCLRQWRAGESEYEQQPERNPLSFGEWFTFNPFAERVKYAEINPHCGQLLCTVVLARILFCALFIGAWVLSLYGLFAGLSSHHCGRSDTHDCEGDYMMQINAYIHGGVYLAVAALMLWPTTWTMARYRDVAVIALLGYPVIFSWALHSDVSHECEDYYTNVCRAAYKYSKIAHLADLGYMALSLGGLLVALCIPGDDEDDAPEDDLTHPDTDLSVVEHLFSKVSTHWKRPLLVQSKVVEYTENVRDWEALACKRNATLKDALEIANEQQADSSAQAKLLGKYSNLINENAEKISQASHLLQDQSKKIGELNDAVTEVIGAMGSSADLKDMNNALKMKGSDFYAWVIVSLLCCLILIGLVIAIPKWLRMFNISLGVSF